MSSEQIIKYNIQYDVRGIDSSIRQSQRLLYFMNAVRLSVTDLQQVMSGPTIANMMWTAVQLTRVWTTAYRWVRATNQAQRMGVAQSIAGGFGRGAAAGAVARRLAVGQTLLSFGEGGALGAAAIPALGVLAGIPGGQLLLGIYAGALLLGASGMGYRRFFVDRQMRVENEAWVQRQREIAKLQGYDF